MNVMAATIITVTQNYAIVVVIMNSVVNSTSRGVTVSGIYWGERKYFINRNFTTWYYFGTIVGQQ